MRNGPFAVFEFALAYKDNGIKAGKFICSRIKKRRKPRVKIVTLKLC